jgi:hypothetical protein
LPLYQLQTNPESVLSEILEFARTQQEEAVFLESAIEKIKHNPHIKKKVTKEHFLNELSVWEHSVLQMVQFSKETLSGATSTSLWLEWETFELEALLLVEKLRYSGMEKELEVLNSYSAGLGQNFPSAPHVQPSQQGDGLARLVKQNYDLLSELRVLYRQFQSSQDHLEKSLIRNENQEAAQSMEILEQISIADELHSKRPAPKFSIRQSENWQKAQEKELLHENQLRGWKEVLHRSRERMFEHLEQQAAGKLSHQEFQHHMNQILTYLSFTLQEFGVKT